MITPAPHSLVSYPVSASRFHIATDYKFRQPGNLYLTSDKAFRLNLRNFCHLFVIHVTYHFVVNQMQTEDDELWQKIAVEKFY